MKGIVNEIGAVIVIKGLAPTDAFNTDESYKAVVDKRWVCVGENEFLPDPTDRTHDQDMIDACNKIPAKFLQGLEYEIVKGVKIYAIPKTEFTWDQVESLMKKEGISGADLLRDARNIPENLEVGIEDIKQGLSIEEMVTGVKPVPKKKTFLQKLFKFLPR